MKNLFRKSLLIIGLVASFISCQTEDYGQQLDIDSNLQQSFEVQYVDWNHFNSENKGIADKISSLNQEYLLARQLNSDSYGFAIDETEVQVIKQLGFTTYTFPIHRDIIDVNTLENYVFKQDSTGNYSQYILTYQYNTDGDGNLICDTNYFDIEEISDDNLLLNRASCFPEFVQVGTETICDIRFHCTGDNHEIGDTSCNCGNEGYDCIPAGISCYDNPVFGWTTCPSGDEPNDNPNDPNNTGGGGTDDETTGNDEDFVFSIPTRTKVEQRIENCLNNVDSNNNNETQILDPSYINLSTYNLSDVEKWQIYMYLIVENNCQEDIKDLVELTLLILDDNNFELDEIFGLFDNFSNPCHRDKILKFIGKTNSELTNFVKNTFGYDDSKNLSLENTNIPPNLEANATTQFPENLNFNNNSIARVKFDHTYINSATDLSVILTTSHELVHVYLGYLFAEGQLLTTFPQYEELNQAFASFQLNDNEENALNLEQAMHDVFDDFIDWMVNSVYNYVIENNIPNVSQEYVRKLVIGSHQNTDTFQLLNQTQQNEYSTIAVNEQTSSENAKGASCN